MTFTERINNLISSKRSFLCIGLDSDIEKLPGHLSQKPNGVVEFNEAIIKETLPYSVAYKLNIAFYESRGVDGWRDLEKTMKFFDNDAIIIADAKRGDIGNTSRQYAKTFFEHFSFDAITVAPYMGYDSISPFVEFKDKGVFVLCLTSNPGSKDFQYLENDGIPLYQKVAAKLNEWNIHRNIGLVAGATHPQELKTLRQLSGDMPFLIPGVGAQGGDLDAVLNHALTKLKNSILINSSRGIIFASATKNFAKTAGEKALELTERMKKYF